MTMNNPLQPLPAGQYYVCSGGREFLDHAGNVYVQEPITLPAAERGPTPPDPSLSAETLTFIEAEETWLSQQPREHFTVFHISESGDILGASDFDKGEVRQEGDETVHEVMVNCSEIVRTAESLKAAGCICLHNHPLGSTTESDADKTLKRTLQETLHRKGVRLLFSHIVPSRTPQVLTEAASPFDSAYDIRVAEHQRLWAHRGGIASWEGRAR
jgi:hypothetical protein